MTEKPDALKSDPLKPDPLKPDPWRVPVATAQIPDTGLHRDLKADEAVRHAIADVGDLREVLSAQASFDVTPNSGGRYHVAGHVRARIGQTCVVTLEPMESDIDEPVELTFAPPDQIPEMAALVDEAEHSDGNTPDPLEAIENGIIDLGRVATDALYLAVNPYPRKPDAVFEALVEAEDPEDHPFAALKALKVEPETPGKKKPKGK
jgi:uncharacterized metal-binding protein YceD (DUF177 family)